MDVYEFIVAVGEGRGRTFHFSYEAYPIGKWLCELDQRHGIAVDRLVVFRELSA